MALLFTFPLFLCSCATIPNGGFYGDISNVGKPGPILGRVQVGEGLLVETIKIDADTEINIQINEDEVGDNESLLFDNVLTIGKFSKWLGSGFTSKENIYYEKRIHDSGKDIFEVNGRQFVVKWKCDYTDARTYLVSDHYEVTVQELFTGEEKKPADE